ncbi:MAG: hypothetical protein CMJ78_03510 [Planctomycetaceae bacterium]|nr:hypothetical protein [Planctomycetaceae bacterium]
MLLPYLGTKDKNKACQMDEPVITKISGHRLKLGVALALVVAVPLGAWLIFGNSEPDPSGAPTITDNANPDSSTKPAAIETETSNTSTDSHGSLTTHSMPAADPVGDSKTFDQSVKPFFEQHCNHCHGSDKAEGDLRLDTLAADFLSRQPAGHWVEVLDRIVLEVV